MLAYSSIKIENNPATASKTTMCRVAVRNTARARPAEPEPAGDDALLYEQLQGVPEVKNELDLNQLFGDADDVDIDADLQFLDMFAAAQATEAGPQAADMNAVLGQPVVDAAPVYAAAPAPAMMAAPVATAQQQQMAALQQFTGMMGAPPAAYAPAAALQQQYTQAILQQHMLAQMTHAGAASASAAPTSKRGKTAAEIAEQQERIKRRRRESAQRSRQRKSAYMKSLESENQCLKVENDRLRRELARLGRPLPPSLYNASTTSGSSAGLDADAAGTGFESLTGGSSEGAGLCPVDGSGLGTGAAQELVAMAL